MADDEKLAYKQIEEAVKVCGAKQTGGSGCFGCPLRGVPRCLNRLFEALTEENKRLREENRWISTAERLPETGDGPIIVMEDYTAVLVLVMIEGSITATTLYFDVDNHDFFDMQVDELIPYRVTRWKPMPKGPEVSHD